MDCVNIIASTREINPEFSTVSLRGNFFDSLRYQDGIPKKMRSKLAHEWPLETLLKLKLAIKGIWIG